MEEDYEYSWYLGDDYDCDTCGMSWNMVRFELWDEDENVWQLYMSVGCYGGESTMSYDEDFAKRAEEIIADCLTYPGFDQECADGLRMRIKEKVG